MLEADSNGSVTRNETFTLAARIRNIGVGAASGLTVTATSDAH